MSDNNIGLNKSANVTLYGAPGAGLSIPQLNRDGVACGAICNNFTALNATNVIFNVSYWTEYKIGDVGNLEACQTLSVAGQIYTLQNDVSTTGTCFTITADNITLDGQSYNVDGVGIIKKVKKDAR